MAAEDEQTAVNVPGYFTGRVGRATAHGECAEAATDTMLKEAAGSAGIWCRWPGMRFSVQMAWHVVI